MDPQLRRPSLLRSPLLWCGLVVLVFLGWAWRDSVGRWAYARAGFAGIQSQASGVALWALPEERGSWDYGTWNASSVRMVEEDTEFYQELLKPRFGRPEIIRRLNEEEAKAFRETRLLDGRKPDPLVGLVYYHEGANVGGPLVRAVFLPYWCVMLAWLGIWLALIYWRYRRSRRVPKVEL